MRRGLGIALLALLPAGAGAAEGPRFTVADAIRAEWARQPIALGERERAALAPGDRARLRRAEERIGAPGGPALLPPELDKPELAAWEALARKARSPAERFTALHFLNRLKSPHGLGALAGLTVEDAKRWPRHLHLEAAVATARLQGDEPTEGVRRFLAALPMDPVRAQAARLRLVMAGKEAQLLPLLAPTPRAVMSRLDAWNKAPWPAREAAHLMLLSSIIGVYWTGAELPAAPSSSPGEVWGRLGLRAPDRGELELVRTAARDRLLDGAPGLTVGAIARGDSPLGTFVRAHLVDEAESLKAFHERMVRTAGRAAAPPVVEPPPQRVAHDVLLAGKDPIGRAHEIEKLDRSPASLEALAQAVFGDGEVDSLQALIEAFDRWKLPAERRRALLAPFLAHPTWIGRYEAWKALHALDAPSGPQTAWPQAVPPTDGEEAILKEAIRLAERGAPVRLRITFAGKRTIVLKLDPTVAPVNVANLALLARRRFFDGRLVPRVVPDFVVQMGSPLDTMDGGPGYAVRCEDSLAWFGPGSVGMALSGKDTGGSQLFITLNAAPHLTGRYTRVGELEELDRAMPLLDELELGARIERVEVVE